MSRQIRMWWLWHNTTKHRVHNFWCNLDPVMSSSCWLPLYPAAFAFHRAVHKSYVLSLSKSRHNLANLVSLHLFLYSTETPSYHIKCTRDWPYLFGWAEPLHNNGYSLNYYVTRTLSLTYSIYVTQTYHHSACMSTQRCTTPSQPQIMQRRNFVHSRCVRCHLVTALWTVERWNSRDIQEYSRKRPTWIRKMTKYRLRCYCCLHDVVSTILVFKT